MNCLRFAAACVAAILFLPASGLAAEDATLTFKATSIATGVGGTKGEGVLTWKGQQIPFTIRGFALGELGITTLEATGTVHNMDFPEKFNGTYDTKKLDGTLVIGKGMEKMSNDSGVVLGLSTKSKGLKLSAALGGSKMELDPDALAKALAAVNAPKVQANLKQTIFFDMGSDDIRKSEKPKLDEVIAYLEKTPSTDVILTGYTDTVGSEKTNKKLSGKRAVAVFQALRQKAKDDNFTQMPPERVDIAGRGQIGGPDNTANQQGRRVDILIIPPTGMTS